MHGRHDVCVSGVFVHMCVYVCLCMSVRCVLIDPNRLRRHSYMCCIHRNVMILMTTNNVFVLRIIILDDKSSFLNKYPYHMRIVLSCMLICTMADDVIKARPNRMLWWVCVCWLVCSYSICLICLFVKIPVELLTSINMHLG